MKNKTLVILAAGMSSRFGGLKQVEPVGLNDEIIADYSVYNAIQAGFKNIVFVIKKEHLNYFKENITCKYANKIKVDFVFQTLNDASIPSFRTKMLGTAHALLMAKENVKESFVVINSDDFYGKVFFEKAIEFLNTNKNEYEYLSINCPLKETLSVNGKVNRGVIFEENNYVKNIIECSVECVNDIVKAQSKKTQEIIELNNNQAVAINYFVFKPSIFSILDSEYQVFIQNITLDNEFCLTDVLEKYIKENKIRINTLNIENNWYGVTYKEDLPKLKKKIRKLIMKGEYPENLWK